MQNARDTTSLTAGADNENVMHMTQFLPLMIAGFVAAAGFTPLTKRLAFFLGVLDQPSSRKIHNNPTPLMGGLAIYGAFVVALALFSPPGYLIEFGAVLASTFWLVLVGFLDDRNGMSPWVKMGGQLVAGVVVVAAGIRVGVFPWLWLNVAVTLFWLVGITNAINFLDNMDGLAAGITAIASFFFFVLAVQEELSLVSSLAAALMGASVGFLLYNFNPASTFMGDMGSMVLGFVLAVLAIKLDFRTPKSEAATWLVPIVILGLPVFDTSLVVFTRLREGRSPMQAGKDHTSHRLVSLGLSTRAAVLTLYAVCVGLGLVALTLARADLRQASWIIAGLLAVALGAFVFMELIYIRAQRAAHH